jgi:translation elongation factor P/translation initiation factor 5A
MFARTALALSLAVALLAAPFARAEVEAGDSVTTSATVESIDLATRIVGLKGADGQTTSVVVPESIQNLDKLKVGDTVMTTYAVAVAVQLLKPGEETAPAAVSSAAGQAAGKIVGANQVSAVLKVESIDLATNSVTVTGPQGNTRTIKVKRPELQEKLKSLKPGDEVQLTFTEAMAISVEPKE